MDRGAWWATVHGAAEELDTTYRLDINNNTKREHECQEPNQQVLPLTTSSLMPNCSAYHVHIIISE